MSTALKNASGIIGYLSKEDPDIKFKEIDDMKETIGDALSSLNDRVNDLYANSIKHNNPANSIPTYTSNITKDTPQLDHLQEGIPPVGALHYPEDFAELDLLNPDVTIKEYRPGIPIEPERPKPKQNTTNDYTTIEKTLGTTIPKLYSYIGKPIKVKIYVKEYEGIYKSMEVYTTITDVSLSGYIYYELAGVQHKDSIKACGYTWVLGDDHFLNEEF